MKHAQIVLGAVLTATVLAGCAFEGPATSRPSPPQSSASASSITPASGRATATEAATSTATAPKVDPPVAPAPDGTRPHPYDFGVFAISSPDSVWDVTITETNTDATGYVLAENPYNPVKEGWQYVLGRMNSEVNTNLKSSRAGQPTSPSSVMPVFIGSDGKIYEIWNDDNSAVVLTEAWISQPEIILQVGVTSSGLFAIQVPSTAIRGGHFASRNETKGTLTHFGPAQ